MITIIINHYANKRYADAAQLSVSEFRFYYRVIWKVKSYKEENFDGMNSEGSEQSSWCTFWNLRNWINRNRKENVKLGAHWNYETHRAAKQARAFVLPSEDVLRRILDRNSKLIA